MLIDSHCHLDRLDFQRLGMDLNGVIDEARQAGISHFLCVCISSENRQRVLEIATQFTSVFASAGVHPCDVTDAVVDVEQLVSWCGHHKIVALGESGLDYHYSPDSAKNQMQSFENHLQAGRQLSLPVIVHTRAAQADTLAAIRSHGCRESSGVLHCFTESWEMAKAALDLNYYISLSGIVTFKNASELREVAKKVPADRLLVETDSPYLAPVPYRGQTNQPKYVREVAQYVAELRGISYVDLADTTTSNFFTLFQRAVSQ